MRSFLHILAAVAVVAGIVSALTTTTTVTVNKAFALCQGDPHDADAPTANPHDLFMGDPYGNPHDLGSKEHDGCHGTQ
jgi:hypothetical protein